MWSINIRQTIRYMISQKKFSFVIIAGLAVGLAASFLVYSYVYYEKSFDNFHEDGKNLYRVVVTARLDGQDPYKSPYSYAPQGPVALNEIPDVTDYVRLFALPSVVISSRDDQSIKSFSEHDYYYADESFLRLFSFPLIYGDPETALKEPGTVVLSQTLAKKLFENKDPVGKEVTVNEQYSFHVSGVFEDIPGNSHLKFNLLFSLNTFPWIMNAGNAWSNHSFFTYLQLRPDADPKEVEKKLTAAYHEKDRAVFQQNCVWQLQPVSEAYLNTADFTSKPEAFRFGDEKMVYFLGLIALFILGIAWVNYFNLTTAKSVERVKEVWVRKSNGAGKWHLIRQFLTESFVLNVFSMLLAAVLVAVVFNWFNTAMSLSTSFTGTFKFWIIPGLVLISGILIPGSISAFTASDINPLKPSSLRGKTGLNPAIRNGLVVFQFAIIIALMSGVMIVNKQLRYIQTLDLGFDKEQILVLDAPRVGLGGQFDSRLQTFRNELIKCTGIRDVTASVSIPGERFGSGNSGPNIAGEQNRDTYFRVGRVYPNYLTFFGIRMLAGRDFSENPEAADPSIIINEEALKEFGIQHAEDALQKTVIWNGRQVSIVGVTRSFHQQSLHIIPEPMIIYTMPYENTYNYILVKLGTQNLKSSLPGIEENYKAMFPGNPCDYFFLDTYYDQQYNKDLAFRKLFSFFSVVAMILGFFGLYGLTLFRTVNRTKEIAVHKVNGAKTSDILLLLNSDLMRWIALAFLLATPISWYAMKNWLTNFAYRTEINLWIYAAAGLLAMSIALITMSWQSWRVATMNPVKSLRYE